MGIASFYRWLCERYPRVPIDARGDEFLLLNNQHIQPNVAMPNPNNMEFDNLYLDMNGIIHPCCHPESGEAPPTEAEMFVKIHEYIDRIFALVRPRKVLYMAIDGVAPRAKMNQQRQRRFRAVQEREESATLEQHLRQVFHDQGRAHELPAQKGPAWDSNVITPGTPFMANLSESLRYYIADRIQNNPGWKDLTVIFSDATVPGEGEHKIMGFIRNQRSQSDYDPNIRHCLYGMDADLIMLSLASHECHFYIVREIVYGRNEMICNTCGRAGHHQGECIGIDKETIISSAQTSLSNYLSNEQLNALIAENTSAVINLRKRSNTPYQFLSIPILREYLSHELQFRSKLFDLERAIDDWVFLCFFVGNDFLPHMPALEIRENAIGLLQKIWKSIIQSKIKAFEERMVHQYLSSLPPQERNKYDPASTSTLSIPIEISPEELQKEMDQIYLTKDGELVLPHVHDFIQKFQLFETAILYSRGKRTSDLAAKQSREKAQKEREAKMVEQIDQDNAKVVGEGGVEVVDANKSQNNDKRGRRRNGQNDQNSSSTGQNDQSSQMGDDAGNQPQGAQRRGFHEMSENKKKNNDKNDKPLPTKNNPDVTTTTTSTTDTSMTSTPMPTPASPLKAQQSEKTMYESSDDETTPPAKRTNTSTTHAASNSSSDNGDSNKLVQLGDKKSEKEAQEADKIEEEVIDLKTGKRIKKTGTDHHVLVMKPKKRNQYRPGNDDEYSKTNAHIAFEAAWSKLKDMLSQAPDEAEDQLKLGTEDYEDRYYLQKFHVDIDNDIEGFEHIHLAYLTGLRWVFHYYYKGCASWNWYYPYHYAPLVTALARIDLKQYQLDVSSPLNPTNSQDLRESHTIITTSLYSDATPILPFEQLLSVFPSQSSHALPAPFADLMTNPLSPISDFYPSQFGLDTAQKKFLWQGVVQLPFIDMPRLKRSAEKRQHLLTADELKRNRHGVSYVFGHLSKDDAETDILAAPSKAVATTPNNISLTMLEIKTQTDANLLKIKKELDKANPEALAVKIYENSQTIPVNDPKLPYGAQPKGRIVYKPTGSVIETISAPQLAKEWEGLVKQEVLLLNGKKFVEYRTNVEPRKTALFSTLRPQFLPQVVPSAPVTLNTFPNENPKFSAMLGQANQSIEFVHDTALWTHSFSHLISTPHLVSLMLSRFDRIVEPGLANLTKFSGRFKCPVEPQENTAAYEAKYPKIDPFEPRSPENTDKTNPRITNTAAKYYLQGEFSPMCEQIVPGGKIVPHPNYQNGALVTLTDLPVVSFIYTQLPSGHHSCKLLSGAIVPDDLLNEQDIATIGFQKHQKGRNNTFEYLLTVIKQPNRGVYEQCHSEGPEVPAFDDLQQDIPFLSEMKGNTNAVGHKNKTTGGQGKKDDKKSTYFSKLFGSERSSWDPQASYGKPGYYNHNRQDGGNYQPRDQQRHGQGQYGNNQYQNQNQNQNYGGHNNQHRGFSHSHPNHQHHNNPNGATYQPFAKPTQQYQPQQHSIPPYQMQLNRQNQGWQNQNQQGGWFNQNQQGGWQNQNQNQQGGWQNQNQQGGQYNQNNQFTHSNPRMQNNNYHNNYNNNNQQNQGGWGQQPQQQQGNWNNNNNNGRNWGGNNNNNNRNNQNNNHNGGNNGNWGNGQ